MIVLLLIFGESPYCFLSLLHQFTFLPMVCKGSRFLHIFSSVCNFRLLMMVIQTGVKLDSHKQKKEPEHCPFLDIKKWIKDLNIKTRNHNIPRSRHKWYPYWYQCGWCFCGSLLHRQGHKTQNKQLGLPQTKRLCTIKETMIKPQRQPTEWENIFIKHVFDHDYQPNI